jgi:hypothetical protein
VTLIDKGVGGGQPGTTDDLGDFSYAPSDTAEQIVSSATVSVSKPELFNSLTLTASLDGEQIGSSTIDAPEITANTVFTFSPPLTIPAGGGESLTFALTGVIAGKHAAAGLSLPDQMKLAGVIGSSNALGATGNLMLGLSLLGFAMFPLSIRTRRRTSILAAAMLMLAVGLVGCSGGSSGGNAPPPSQSSTQKLIALNVTENGIPVPTSGLPINLGKITKK